MTILSAHQPVYLPGIILFNKIAMSDVFVFLSHVQFERHSWQQRNRIRNAGTSIYLTVPTKRGYGQEIRDTRIDGMRWKRKHLAGLEQAYRKRPYFHRYYPDLKEIITTDWEYLCDMNICLIQHIMKCLGIDTPVLDTRNLDVNGKKNAMLVNLCKTLRADAYLSNEGARAYIDEELFRSNGIQHLWQKYCIPVYEQGGDFIENLSIVDFLFNLGPETSRLVQGVGEITSTQDNAGEYHPVVHNKQGSSGKAMCHL